MNTPGKCRGELRATPMTDQPCSAKRSAAARPIPFDAPVMTMDLRITSPQIASRVLHGGDEWPPPVELLGSCDSFLGPRSCARLL
jgi:hypothetical protein